MLGVSASSENATSLQSDVLAGLWQELQKAAEAVAQEDSDVCSEADEPQQHQQTTTPQDAALVGPTTAELESIKELIQFDHEYMKPIQVHSQAVKKPANIIKVIAAAPAAAPAAKSVVVKPTCNITSNNNVNNNLKKQQKMVSVVNVNVSTNCPPKPVYSTSISNTTITNCQQYTTSVSPVTPVAPMTPLTPDTGLNLPEFFETEDILNFNTDLIMKDLDIDKLLTGGLIDNELNPADVGKEQQQPQQTLSSVISQDNPRKRKCSDANIFSSTVHSSNSKQPKTDDFCSQTVVKFDDIFSQNDDIHSESIASELSEAGSPASIVSTSSSISHDDLWEESFSELFPTLV